jgi:hypothetical protein
LAETFLGPSASNVLVPVAFRVKITKTVLTGQFHLLGLQ